MDYWGILIYQERNHSRLAGRKSVSQILFVEEQSPKTYNRIKEQFQEHYDIIAGRPGIQEDDLLRINQNVGSLVTRANDGTAIDTKQFEEALEMRT